MILFASKEIAEAGEQAYCIRFVNEGKAHCKHDGRKNGGKSFAQVYELRFKRNSPLEQDRFLVRFFYHPHKIKTDNGIRVIDWCKVKLPDELIEFLIIEKLSKVAELWIIIDMLGKFFVAPGLDVTKLQSVISKALEIYKQE